MPMEEEETAGRRVRNEKFSPGQVPSLCTSVRAWSLFSHPPRYLMHVSEEGANMEFKHALARPSPHISQFSTRSPGGFPSEMSEKLLLSLFPSLLYCQVHAICVRGSLTHFPSWQANLPSTRSGEEFR